MITVAAPRAACAGRNAAPVHTGTTVQRVIVPDDERDGLQHADVGIVRCALGSNRRGSGRLRGRLVRRPSRSVGSQGREPQQPCRAQAGDGDTPRRDVTPEALLLSSHRGCHRRSKIGAIDSASQSSDLSRKSADHGRPITQSGYCSVFNSCESNINVVIAATRAARSMCIAGHGASDDHGWRRVQPARRRLVAQKCSLKKYLNDFVVVRDVEVGRSRTTGNGRTPGCLEVRQPGC